MNQVSTSTKSPKKKKKRFFRFLNRIFSIFVPKYKFIWDTMRPKESENIIYISNHTKMSAPIAWRYNYDRKLRFWSNNVFLSRKTALEELFRIIEADEYPCAWLLKIFARILTPGIVWVFKSLDPIPVYHHMGISKTYKKTVESLESGEDVIIYCERPHTLINKYINELQPGFFYAAIHYYQKTGKRLSFYPTYCAPSIKTIIIGKPFVYDPEIPGKQQMFMIKAYLEKEIERIADSLPPHKIELMNNSQNHETKHLEIHYINPRNKAPLSTESEDTVDKEDIATENPIDIADNLDDNSINVPSDDIPLK